MMAVHHAGNFLRYNYAKDISVSAPLCRRNPS